MSKVDGLPVEKECPECGNIGVAKADEDGDHLGIWVCGNDCEVDFFASSVVRFYDTETNESDSVGEDNSGWTWDELIDEYT